MAVLVVPWDAQPILRPVPVLTWWHLHTSDQPWFCCQPSESLTQQRKNWKLKTAWKLQCTHNYMHVYILNQTLALSVYVCVCRNTYPTSTLWAASWAWRCFTDITSTEASLCHSINSYWENPSRLMTWRPWTQTCTTASYGSCESDQIKHTHINTLYKYTQDNSLDNTV